LSRAVVAGRLHEPSLLDVEDGLVSLFETRFDGCAVAMVVRIVCTYGYPNCGPRTIARSLCISKQHASVWHVEHGVGHVGYTNTITC
jgi:hypothetical protein